MGDLLENDRHSALVTTGLDTTKQHRKKSVLQRFNIGQTQEDQH